MTSGKGERNGFGWNIFSRFRRLADFNGMESVVPYKLLFVSSYGAFGALLPYLPLYFKQIGLSAMETGVLIGLRPLLQAFGAPMWGFLADKYKRRKLILFMGAVAWIVKAMLILAVQPRNQACVTVDKNNTVSELNGTAAKIDERRTHSFDLQNLVDQDSRVDVSNTEMLLANTKSNLSTSTHNILNTQQRDLSPRQYKAKFRHSAQKNHKRADKENLANLTTKINAHQTQSPSGHNIITYEIKVDDREMSTIFGILLALIIVGDFFGSVLHPLSDGCVLDYLGDERNMFGILDGFQMDFSTWFLDDLGASSFVVGLASSLHFLCNVVTFLVANYALQILGYVNLISISLLIYAVIFTCFSFAQSPWLGMVLYILFGTCFAMSWTACVSYAALLASDIGMGATAQGILSGLYVGLGYGGGTMLGGLLISFTGIRTTFRLYAALAVVSVILYNVLQRLGKSSDDSEPEIKYKAVPFTEEDKDKN
ncbi:hypothetical protein ACROYT_G017756 [Oculina patagonica]